MQRGLIVILREQTKSSCTKPENLLILVLPSVFSYSLLLILVLRRLGFDGADYLKNQLEAAGIVTATDDEERDSPSSEDRRSNLSNGDTVSLSNSSASIPLVATSRGLGSLDSQVRVTHRQREYKAPRRPSQNLGQRCTRRTAQDNDWNIWNGVRSHRLLFLVLPVSGNIQSASLEMMTSGELRIHLA